jgi:pimeloyl-ACP methyl ester carboxylesterase
VVAFRGSVTTKDFQQDAKAIFSSVENPLPDPPDILAIHFGFKEYLYGEEKWTESLFLGSTVRKDRKAALQGDLVDSDARTAMNANEELPAAKAKTTYKEDETSMKKQKYKIIMTQLQQIFDECPDYSLYVCGHSLGGALATLFAFECAAATRDDESSIPHPVTVITSGAPKVGNIDFLLAFESLEEQGRLRCLRVANYRDIVTLSPPIGALALCHAICCQERRFRHVGFRLKLSPWSYVISYPPKVRSYCGTLLFDLIKMARSFFFMAIFIPVCAVFSCGAKKFLRGEHTQLVYMNRFDKQKESLEKVTLDQLYEERFARARWRIPVFYAGAVVQSTAT